MLNCGYIEYYELTEGLDENVHKRRYVEISSQEVHVVQSEWQERTPKKK